MKNMGANMDMSTHIWGYFSMTFSKAQTVFNSCQVVFESFNIRLSTSASVYILESYWTDQLIFFPLSFSLILL